MRLAMLEAFLVVVVAWGPASGQAVKPQDLPVEMVPTPNYTPREGDRVMLVADATPGFSGVTPFDDYYKNSDADEQAAIKAMIEKGQLVDLGGKVPVLVLRNLDPADSREPGRNYPVEVRILSGTRTGETWFVAESALARMVPKVVHPPLEKGAYATVASPKTIAYARWEAFDPAARSVDKGAAEEAFRPEAGAKVVVLESRGDAVRIRVHSRSKLTGREGVVERAALRPVVPPSRPVESRPPAAGSGEPAEKPKSSWLPGRSPLRAGDLLAITRIRKWESVHA